MIESYINPVALYSNVYILHQSCLIIILNFKERKEKKEKENLVF